MRAFAIKNPLASLMLVFLFLARTAAGQSPTSTLRLKIDEDLQTNVSKQITAAKLRSVITASADAIDSTIARTAAMVDSVYTTFSLADGIGEYDASTGLATVLASGASSTPGTTPAFANGKYFDVVKAGTRSITGTAINMQPGGKIIVRSTVWSYIPPSDAAMQKTIAIDGNIDDLYKKTTGRLARSLAAPLPFTRNNSTGAPVAAGNMGQIKNSDRSVTVIGYNDSSTGSLITDMQTGVSPAGVNKVQFDFAPSNLITTASMTGIGYVSGGDRIIYLWSSTGLISYAKTGTNTFSQILAANSAREYAAGDRLRMELVFSGSTVTLNLYKGSSYTLIATTSTIPSTFQATGDLIIGMRGSMSFTYSLTTEQTGEIANSVTTARSYTDAKISTVQSEMDSITIASANILPPVFVDGSSFRNSDGTIAATPGTKRTANLIAVQPGTQYTITGIRTNFVGNEYKGNTANSANRNKAISPVESGSNITSYTWKTTDSTYFIGLNITSFNSVDEGKAMLVKGLATPANFEAYGARYLTANKLRGTLPVESEVAAMRKNSVNLLAGGFTSGTIYRQGDGTIGSSGTPAKRTTSLIPVLPNTEYTAINFNTTFLGNEYSGNSATSDNRVRAIAPLAPFALPYSTHTFTTSPTTHFVGLNVVVGSTDPSNEALFVQGKSIPKAYEAAGQKYIDGTKIRGTIPGNDLPNIYYAYDADGFNDTEGGSVQSTGLFTVFCRYSANSPFYAGYRIGRVLNTTIRADLWRVVGADLYKWDGATMVPQMVPLLNSSESEFVWQETGKSDFTGGYHGDELLTEVFFYADAIRLDITADIPITPAADFWYIQKSDMIETDNPSVVNRCVHHKNTRFEDAGFTTKNRVTWSSPANLSILFSGLVTVTHNQSGVIYNENYDYLSTTAPAVGVSLFQLPGGESRLPNGQHEINYFNSTTGMGAVVTSKLTKAVSGSTDNTAAYDRLFEAYVRDITNYAKYYRQIRQRSVVPGEVWEVQATFKPYKR